MISIITPVHESYSKFVGQAYQSLKDQIGNITWEWIVVLNNGGEVPDYILEDVRVKTFHSDANKVGALKHYAVSVAEGDIIVELDADDMLIPSALCEINNAFEDSSIAMVYSNSAEFEDTTWESRAYSNYWGWEHRDFEWQGHTLKEMIAWEPSPHMMRQIFWAPNHVRAWRTKDYHAIGGHDKNLYVGDDHDLCCRFYIAYGADRIKHIDKCLYLYRVHGNNTCVVDNKEVQKISKRNYRKYSRDMATRWAKENDLRLLDLGGRFNAWTGYETVDRMDADLIMDLEKSWKIEDNSVGVLRAKDIFEHLHDPIFTMNEAYRVLAPGGWLFIDVPSTDGRGAFQDPTHVSFWNENSFWYYTDKNYAKFIKPEYKGRFQKSRIITWFPSEFHKENNIPYVQADLICLKLPYSDRPVGEVLI